MKVEEIHSQLLNYREQGKRIFISSSFQTHSIPLLHILSKSDVPFDVLFINTGYHFAATLTFRDQIAKLLSLKVIDLLPLIPKIQQMDKNRHLLFVSDPDYCCDLNKVSPMNAQLHKYDVWISGVRAEQSHVRRNMKVEQAAPNNTMRFHPMLDWDAKMILEYRKQHDLPEHPLDAKGYQSIGCVPCTAKVDLFDERSVRWYGMSKTECGLHTELVSKK